MRKILIGMLVIIIMVGSASIMVNGTDKIDVKGYFGISEKNQQVEEKISELSNVINVSYSNALANLKSTSNKLQQSKTEYENQAILSKSNSSSYISKMELYDIDYLWTKLGNYAKEEGIIIKIDVVSNQVSNNLYDLNFTATGSYMGTTNFIYDIENDSNLGFKIDDFKMTAESDFSIYVTFVCKDIPINVGTADIKSPESTVDEETAEEGDKESAKEDEKATNTKGNTTNSKSTNDTSKNTTKNNSTTTNTVGNQTSNNTTGKVEENKTKK